MVIKHPLAKCDECPLRSKQFYQQPFTKSKYLFIGSAPILAEGFKGGFFNASDAGKLTHSVCSFHGIDRNDVAYTTAVKCSGFADLSSRDKKIAIKCCNEALFDDIEKHNPEAVVTMGADASLSAVGRGTVGTLRVGPARLSATVGCPVVSTVSPWVCLAQESQFQFFVTDIGKLVNTPPVFNEPEFEVFTDMADSLDKIVDWTNATQFTTENKLVLDIEVAMEKDINFEHPERFEMLCIGLKYNDNVIGVFAEDALSPHFYKALSILANKCKVIAHNGKFDLAGLRPLCGKINLSFDTMLASYVFDERTGIHGLKYLSQEYLGAPAYDDEIKELVGPSKDFGKIPRDILYKYNAYDIHCTSELEKLYSSRFESNPELLVVHDMLVNASNMLQDVENVGMKIDEDYLSELEISYGLSLKDGLNVLRDMVVNNHKSLDHKLGFNPNSYNQIKEFLSAMGVKVPNTAKDTLDQVRVKIATIPDAPDNLLVVDKFIENLMEYKSEVKLYGTYIDGTRQRLYRGKVHPTYLLHGTTTGRLSARNPNTQNIASRTEIKRLFVSSAPDRSLCHADYSQAELRILSWFAQDQYFRAIFNDPSRDIFDELIADIYEGAVKGTTEEELFEWKMKRRVIKTVVYGLNYGRTEYGIAHGLGIDVEEAKGIKDKFFSVIPDIINWQEEIKKTVRDGYDLVTPFGRHRRYSLLTKENERKVMNEALAFMPQSTASDITLNAAISLNKIFADNWDSAVRPRIINLVHDDIIVDCADDDIPVVENLLRQEMIGSAQKIVGDYVLFDVDAGHAKDWGSLH